MRWEEWVRKRDLPRLARALQRAYPKGLAKGREGLRTQLMDAGVSYSEAASTAEALEEAGYAHHLPGDKGRWVFTTTPVSLAELMRALDEEFAAFVGAEEEPREELLEFIGTKLGVDQDVAEELLSGLEAAGYTSLVYAPEHKRDRMLVRFPEVLHRGL
jgi:hypothetical protein